MKRLLIYFGFGFTFMLLQTTILPRVIPSFLKPDLLLVLVVYLGLNEDYGRGGVLAYLLGCLQDVFAGNYLGLYGFVFLVTFFAVKGAVRWFNTDNSSLLLLLVFWGTLLEGVLVLFSLGTFAEAGPVWPIVLRNLLPQALTGAAVAFLLLQTLSRWQRRRGPGKRIPGLRRRVEHGF